MFTNKYGQRVTVVKNPKSWRSRWSVRAYCGKGWSEMLVSHHSTRPLAVQAAARLRNKNILVLLGWKKKKAQK